MTVLMTVNDGNCLLYARCVLLPCDSMRKRRCCCLSASSVCRYKLLLGPVTPWF